MEEQNSHPSSSKMNDEIKTNKNKINNNFTEDDKLLIDKYRNQMNYRLIPLIPVLGQPNVKVPLITCPNIVSKIEMEWCVPIMRIKPKPSTLKAYPENPWSITSTFKLKSSSEKHRMPIKLFSFMFTREKSNTLNLNNIDDHLMNSFYYFRPAINNSIKTDSDLRQYLIDSLTKILLDYCVKKEELEISNTAQNIPLNVSDATSDYKYYKFRSNMEPILSHKRFKKDYENLKLCLAYKPNSKPLVPMLENLINILTFGGEFKEIDGFINFFESETHTALTITKTFFSNHNIDVLFPEASKLFNDKILKMSDYTSNGLEDRVLSTPRIDFIPGKSTYELHNIPPPAYI
ncbi:hypothetical protein BN7_3548 [Wickerhamomyces ciferrii]|uniref:Uncharacterized protein n=1 Tax=Wickerhamomyces ciferrii (strain ATCC 14091 / BCRC 22168 / CBS 111 / JCM 3599 / NBRC 0793 / NRRL Y-1031 F-60-10) TaxID=1206466 RepID=K0KRP3_WICCF|nr:uncharacterized protein BN7_3548 [Wickerhamomyces ciferrii]CCH43994.1 hypothetical protein BN7_3548 [Wickerhamomyces ciferrii]